MSQAHQITDPADAREFALAGNAIFTVVSRGSGARFTYKVRACEENASLFFVSVLTDADNNSGYTYLGTIRTEQSGPRFAHGRKSRIGMEAASYRAFAWVWLQIAAGKLPAAVEFWHEGRCGRCGRRLTVPESIERGIGPECAGRMAA